MRIKASLSMVAKALRDQANQIDELVNTGGDPCRAITMIADGTHTALSRVEEAMQAYADELGERANAERW